MTNQMQPVQTYDGELLRVGTTAERDEIPNTRLPIGWEFFDTTLGYPVWFNGTIWVGADGEPAGGADAI